MNKIFIALGILLLIGSVNAIYIITDNIEEGKAEIYLENKIHKTFYIDYINWNNEVYAYTKEIEPNSFGKIYLEAEKDGTLEVRGHYSDGTENRDIEKIEVIEKEECFITDNFDYYIPASENQKKNDYFNYKIEQKEDSLEIIAENWTNIRQEIDITADGCKTSLTKLSVAPDSEITENIFVFEKEDYCIVSVESNASKRKYSWEKEKEENLAVIPLINDITGFFSFGNNLGIGILIIIGLMFYFGFTNLGKRSKDKFYNVENIYKNTSTNK